MTGSSRFSLEKNPDLRIHNPLNLVIDKKISGKTFSSESVASAALENLDDGAIEEDLFGDLELA